MRFLFWFNFIFGGIGMSNFNWCHGPECHKSHTLDRVRGVKGSKVLRTRKVPINNWNKNTIWKYFCSQGCKIEWLSENMDNIEQGRPIEFIRHRRESQGYEKVTEENDWGRNYTYIKRVDNRTEIE